MAIKPGSKKHCTTPYVVYILVIIIIFVVNKLTPLRGYLDIVAAILFLYIPIIFLFIKKQHPVYYGISKKGALTSIKRAILLASLIFPLYTLCFYLYMRYMFRLGMSFSMIKLLHQHQLFLFLLNNLLMVAIPEEFFYRGYLQSELRKCDRKSIRLAGIKIGLSFISVNTMFALGHLILIPEISRLAVFFPGLIFSWLREKDDNIAGSILFHWLSNTLSFILFSMLL